ncbi:unnamed protein product [Lampetra planeri]
MNKAPKKVQQLSQTGFRGKMANFVQMLQSVLLLFVVIVTSGITDSVAEAEKCPMHAGLMEAKAMSLQKEAVHLTKYCEQVCRYFSLDVFILKCKTHRSVDKANVTYGM